MTAPALVLAVLLAGIAPAAGQNPNIAPHASADVDLGGSIWRKNARGEDALVAWAREAHRTGYHRLPLTCVSACTMRLIIPQSCIQRGAWFGVHTVTDAARRPAWGGDQTAANAFIRFPALRDHIARSGAFRRVEVTWYPAETFARFGVPYCKRTR